MELNKILPIGAIAAGVALVMATSGFTKAPKANLGGDQLYTFQYNPPGTDPYSVNNVEDENNWSLATPEDACPSGSIKACQIQASQVDLSGPVPMLLASEAIQAAVTPGTTSAKVTMTADAVGNPGNITNRSN
ncbi:MAG TPA: hypothetical protein VL053_10065 [Arachidicoccus sp.]|nr:hypothetical protein [Arachidicoccus sp.]